MHNRTIISLALLLAVVGSTVVAQAPYLPHRRKAFQVAPGGGTPAFVDYTSNQEIPSTTTITVTNTIAAGGTIVIGVAWEDVVTTASAASSIDGALTGLTAVDQGDQIFGRMLYKINCTAGTHIVTVTLANAAGFRKVGFYELSGVTSFDDPEPTPGAGTLGGSGAPAITGNITTDNNVEALIGFTMNYNGVTATHQTDWTEVHDINAFNSQYRITTATGTYHGEAVLAGSSSYVCFMAAFK